MDQQCDSGETEDYSEPCFHPGAAVRQRILSNGTRAIFKQCTRCGNSISKAIGRATLTPEQLANLEPFDEELKKSYDAKYLQGIKARNEARDRERELKRVEHSQAYHDYLLTPMWRLKRDAVLRRDNHVCQGCLTRPATEVHHKNYDTVFDEVLFDLVSVCHTCHQKIHNKGQFAA